VCTDVCGDGAVWPHVTGVRHNHANGGVERRYVRPMVRIRPLTLASGDNGLRTFVLWSKGGARWCRVVSDRVAVCCGGGWMWPLQRTLRHRLDGLTDARTCTQGGAHQTTHATDSRWTGGCDARSASSIGGAASTRKMVSQSPSQSSTHSHANTTAEANEFNRRW
jgi:hypothetical protein